MGKFQKYGTFGVAILAAASAIYLMQSNGVGPSLVAPASRANAAVVSAPADPAARPTTDIGTRVAASEGPQAIPRASEPMAFPGMPVPPAEALGPTLLPATGTELRQRMLNTASAVPASEPAPTDVPRNEFGLSCGPLMTGSAGPSAMVSLTLTAPCRQDQEFTLRQGEMTFTAKMNHLGSFSAKVPALQADAEFIAQFADGETALTTVSVPMTEVLQRVVLLSQADTGLQIHALEFGAGYDDPGHIWADSPGSAVSARQTGGGFITRLGDDRLDGAQIAEIYTYPADAAKQDGVVRLSIEIEVTALNCSKEIAGRAMQNGPDGPGDPVSLTLQMPDCDAIGEFLVLKNLLRDLTIASN